jgi:hypothetical protein
MYIGLVILHVFIGCLGIGIFFSFEWIWERAKNAEQFSLAKSVVERLGNIADNCFKIQLLTGLGLGWFHPGLFQLVWYDLSIFLLLIAGFYWRFITKRKWKSVDEKLLTNDVYQNVWKKVIPHIWFGRVILIVILILMVTKPVSF